MARYAVDWNDAAYPKIFVTTDDDPAFGGTLAEAKQEIIDHFQYQIQHARYQIAEARKTTARSLRWQQRQ